MNPIETREPAEAIAYRNDLMARLDPSSSSLAAKLLALIQLDNHYTGHRYFVSRSQIEVLTGRPAPANTPEQGIDILEFAKQYGPMQFDASLEITEKLQRRLAIDRVLNYALGNLKATDVNRIKEALLEAK